ncbi:MAG TPA: hypothetical protein VNL17_12440 [Verrucomicrobiae bacterium]|nr:hypothetical protein [Verrucomicrobiae bacterium]
MRAFINGELHVTRISSWRTLVGSICVAILFVALSGSVNAVTLGQIDNFQDGTADGWHTGGGTQPSNIATGGPGGSGDQYMRVISTGGFGTDSRLVILNTSQWLGNYTGAGITGITLELANFGAQPLSMRLAFFISKPNGYAATTAFSLPADANWHQAFFPLIASDFTAVGTPGISFDNMLTNFTGQLRILDSASPSVEGDPIAATLGVDDITAVPEPSVFALVVGTLVAFVGLRRGLARVSRSDRRALILD